MEFASLVALALCFFLAPVVNAAETRPEAVIDSDRGESQPAYVEHETLVPEAHDDDPSAVNTPRPGRDPFTYGAREDAGYVSVANARIPSDIQLLGVIVMKGEKPIAAIRVPGAHGVLFVSEGSVVQVAAPPSEDKKKSATEPVYIFINRITADEVEVSPRTRPEDKRILR
jgi:hypothetical protein